MFERPPLDSDRSFTAWLDQEAQLRPPDALLSQVLTRTAATRRRPGWLVIERWFPMDTTARFGAISRAAIFLVTLGLLVLLVAAIAVGAAPNVPPPYGPARNGAIVYSQGGDIYLADADGTNPRPIVTGPDNDRYPSFSRDGTRIMFGRGDDADLAVMIADADGTGGKQLTTAAIWADFLPNGTEVYATHMVDGKTVLSIYDLETGKGRDLPTGDRNLMGWVVTRPPDGRELVFMDHVQPGGPERAMYAIATDGKTPPRMIGEPDANGSPDGAVASSASWSFQDPSISLDGKTIAYWSWEPGAQRATSAAYMHQRDLDTGADLPVPYVGSDGYGLLQHFSPDGTWVAFESETSAAPGFTQQVYLAPVDGRTPPVAVGPAYRYTYRVGFDFSPDGTKLMLVLRDFGKSVIVDLATKETTEVAQITDAWGWQRLAP